MTSGLCVVPQLSYPLTPADFSELHKETPCGKRVRKRDSLLVQVVPSAALEHIM